MTSNWRINLDDFEEAGQWLKYWILFVEWKEPFINTLPQRLFRQYGTLRKMIKWESKHHEQLKLGIRRKKQSFCVYLQILRQSGNWKHRSIVDWSILRLVLISQDSRVVRNQILVGSTWDSYRGPILPKCGSRISYSQTVSHIPTSINVVVFFPLLSKLVPIVKSSNPSNHKRIKGC